METIQVVLESQLEGVRLISRGKVRDIYEVGDHLLILSTDRISAFDYVLGNGIPDKGKVLNQLSLFWFEKTREIVPNHLVTAEVDQYPAALAPHRETLKGRSVLVRRAKMFSAECVVRGYLAGSGWKEYGEKARPPGWCCRKGWSSRVSFRSQFLRHPPRLRRDTMRTSPWRSWRTRWEPPPPAACEI